MKLKKMKRFFAAVMACACVCSGFGSIPAQASQTVEPQQTEETMTVNAVQTNDIAQEGKVTFGVVSDTHVTASKTTEKERLAKAFQRFSNLGLDRMVVVGDLTDGGSTSEYDTWKEIKDTNLTIPLIASMGNHEGNSAAGFEEATGNIPNNNQVVNGYHFITLSPGSGTLDETTGRGSAQGGGNYTYTLEWLKQQLDAAVAEDPNKPIFVFFHHPIKNTFYVSHEWYGSGLEEIFKDYPQVVSFSGHIHSPNNNPTSIWQDGGYTAVNTVTLSYMELETGMIYGSIPPNANNVAQGLEVTVDGSVVTIKNYDFIADQYLDQTWTFDITKELPYTEERKAGAVAPEFDDTDKVTVSEITDNSAKIEFDQASVPENSVGDVVHSYKYDFINKATGKVAKTFRTFSEYYFTPMPETISYTTTELKAGTEYELQIHAIDAYGLVSEDYLTETFKTTGIDKSALTFEDMTAGLPTADLLDVDFSGGVITDHSPENHTFYGSDGSNIAMNETLGKYVAIFTGQESEAFCTDWTSAQYAKTNDGFTMESVVYVDAFGESYVNFFGNMQSAGIGFEIYPNSDDATKADVAAFVHIDGEYRVPKATAAIDFNSWNHMAVTYNDSKVILYVNGERVASVAVEGSVTTPRDGAQYYVIGGDSGSSYGAIQSPISGQVSTARMYSEPMTEKQVKMLANRELKSLDTDKPLIQKANDTQKTATQAAKKAQTVTAKNVTKTYGAKAFKLGAKTDGDGTLTYASGNKKVVTVAADGKVSIKGCGKTTITIKAAETNAYKAATKKITVTVKPKKQKVSSVKSTKAKTITVKWAKDTKATGYVLQYSTDKNFKKGVKTVTISNNKTTSKKISKLKSEKKYYVRVCSYKKASESKLQGNYSAVKSVTVK